MNNIEFREKRDQDGLLLHSKGYELSHRFVDKFMLVICEYEVYKRLTRKYDSQYVEFYFRKMFFYGFLPIANQIVINEWDIKNNNSAKIAKIDISSFPCAGLLLSVCHDTNKIVYTYSIRSKLVYYINNFKRRFRGVRRDILNFVLRLIKPKTMFESSTSVDQKNKPTIGISFGSESNIKKIGLSFLLSTKEKVSSKFLVYFSLRMNDSKEIIKYIEGKGGDWVNVFYWSDYPRDIEKTDLLIIENIVEPLDCIHKWLLFEVKTLLIEVNYWYHFFKKFNIKVHSDATEYGLDIIIKQIALDKLNAVSFSSQRSYLDNQLGKLYSCYPSDIFFAWGKDAAQRMSNKIQNNDNPKMHSIVISGCQYLNPLTLEESHELEYIQKKFTRLGVKKIILLLDSNHAMCEDWNRQIISTTKMEEIYSSLLLLVRNNNIGLIIKSKKINELSSLRNIKQCVDFALETGRLYIVPDPDGRRPSIYARLSDLVIGVTSHDIPASVVECVLLNKPGLIFDYPNLSSVENDFYSWAENIIIFKNLDIMIEAIEAFISNSGNFNSIGDWSNNLDNFDPFCDLEAASRIVVYITSLLQSYAYYSEKNKYSIISNTNKTYKKEHGDNIILV